jgi:REP element-mobilizing transposase RayT
MFRTTSRRFGRSILRAADAAHRSTSTRPRRPRKRHTQLTLDAARKSEPGRHGGWRPGAGRPKKPGAVSHAARPSEPARFPQHVTLRIADGVSSLARGGLMKIIRRCIRRAHKPDFRICEFNVLGNHLHLITEAADKDALARGLQGFEVSVARRLNPALMRSGKLFAHRYHARYLKTPREVRNALRYVLLNRKHHDAEKRFSKQWIDPCSSAAWFAGWAQPVRADEPWKRELLAMERPTATPTVWLLTDGWKKHGGLRFEERPGGG